MDGIEPVIPLTPVKKLRKVVQKLEDDSSHPQSKQQPKHPPEIPDDEQPSLHIDEMA